MIEQFNESFANLIDKLEGWINAMIMMLPNFVLAVVVLLLSYLLSRWIKKYVRKVFKQMTDSKAVTKVLANVTTTLFMLVMLFVALGIMNLDKTLTTLIGTAGVIGLAIGLALQDPLMNAFSGIILSVRKLYDIGDLIETNDHFGVVTESTLRATYIRVPTGELVIIPNKDIITNPLKNYTKNGRRKVVVECGVAYGDDLEKVREIALSAVGQAMDIAEESIEFFYTGFGDSSINFKLRFWSESTVQMDINLAKSKAIIALKKAFDNEGVTIPFPIRTLDFGVVGGLGIDEIYPSEKVFRMEPGDEKADNHY